MSDSEEIVEEIIPLPKNRVRFSDMPGNLREKVIRRKSLVNLAVCSAADNACKAKALLDKEVAT